MRILYIDIYMQTTVESRNRTSLEGKLTVFDSGPGRNLRRIGMFLCKLFVISGRQVKSTLDLLLSVVLSLDTFK